MNLSDLDKVSTEGEAKIHVDTFLESVSLLYQQGATFPTHSRVLKMVRMVVNSIENNESYLSILTRLSDYLKLQQQTYGFLA